MDHHLKEILKPFLSPNAHVLDYSLQERKESGKGEICEVLVAYEWRGDHYVVVLNHDQSDWRVIGTIDGTGNSFSYFHQPSENVLKIGWEEAGAIHYEKKGRGYEICNIVRDDCTYQPFDNQSGIDFSALTYVCSETKRDPRLEAAIEKEFDVKLSEVNIRYFYNKIDLNDDGIEEVFVYLVGPFVCGTGGCSAVLFGQKEGEYLPLSRFSLVRNPVIVTNTVTNGYRDLIMYVAGGGIESFFARLSYDGSTYPLNPSVQPKVEAGTKVEGVAIVADDLAENPGIGR
ncbi:hypothetical protein H0266_08345 [Halobacillus locisalis]|uniref:Uncharacterized protein n=1 Tax=Halobacillus locisalis TaxID=220753 RepID=A0A838CS99_9BACI|nr:hypothetical protein [Halobacillus locisalis]MBA2174900.1 hypothetical protein [Halobacillus locisalis]